jgi:hypothetical protein
MAGKAVMEKLASQASGNFRPFGTKNLKTNEAMDEREKRELAELLALKPTNSLTLQKTMNDPKLKF